MLVENFVNIVPRIEALADEFKRRFCVEPEPYAASEALIYQGQLARGLFLVLSGMIYIRSRSEGATMASSLEADESYGLIVPSLPLLDRPMPATIATARRSHILFISRTRLVLVPEVSILITENTFPFTEIVNQPEL